MKVKTELLTVKDVAKICKAHPHSIYRLIGKKAVPYLRLAGIGIRFDRDIIEKWFEESEIPAVDWSEEDRFWD